MKLKVLEIVLMMVLFFFVAGNSAVQKKKFSVEKASPDSSSVVVEETVRKSTPEKTLFKQFADAQRVLREKVSAYVTSIKEGDWRGIGSFLLLCFVYGLLHALGPGHGKSIVVGYFLSRKGGWKQGLGLGASITFAHTFSAVLLLFTLYAILKATVFPTFEKSRGFVEMGSYALVILTGIILIVLGIKEGVSRKSQEQSGQPSCANWKEILWVAAVTGIVPCPAVALVVLFCLLHSMVGLSLLGALFICLGMTSTNAFFGLSAVALRKGVDAGAKKSRYAGVIYSVVSVTGGVVVLVTGILLMTNGNFR